MTIAVIITGISAVWYIRSLKHDLPFKRGFDIGSYFNEMMINLNHAEYPFFTFNTKFYPNKEQQLHFIRAYLDEYSRLQPLHRDDNRNLLEEQLLIEANYFAMASNFYWAVCSICEAASSCINSDFSYLVNYFILLFIYKEELAIILFSGIFISKNDYILQT